MLDRELEEYMNQGKKSTVKITEMKEEPAVDLDGDEDM